MIMVDGVFKPSDDCRGITRFEGGEMKPYEPMTRDEFGKIVTKWADDADNVN